MGALHYGDFNEAAPQRLRVGRLRIGRLRVGLGAPTVVWCSPRSKKQIERGGVHLYRFKASPL